MWWPAVRVPTPEEFSNIHMEDTDMFVQIFFPGQPLIYSVSSIDHNAVQPLRWDRTGCDAPLFRDPRVERSLACADEFRRRGGNQTVARCSTSEHPPSLDTSFSLPFSAEDHHKIQRLLASLDPAVAAELRPSLSALAPPVAAPSRIRRAKPTVRLPSSPMSEAADPPHPPQTKKSERKEELVSHTQSRTNAEDAGHRPEDHCDEGPSSDVNGDDDAVFDEASLEVLRMETFDNRERFILNPTQKFVNVLGAVSVRSAALKAVLPNRGFHYQGTHRASDRVLLVPFDPISYSHTVGWMEEIVMDSDNTLQLRILINGHAVDIPRNWSIAASKTGGAIRSAIPLDITDVIECTFPDEEAFEIRIDFLNGHLVPETILWDVALACILVEEVDIEHITAVIRDNCRSHVGGGGRKGRHRSQASAQQLLSQRAATTCETQEVNTRCPLTSVLLQVPCRGRRCEHPQCMELSAILQQCTQRHVWNCPLCNEPMPPDGILVDYALMELLKNRSARTADAIVLWHESTGTYSSRHKRQRPESAASELIVD